MTLLNLVGSDAVDSKAFNVIQESELSQSCVDGVSALEKHRQWLHGRLAQDIETLRPLFREIEAAGYPFERKPQTESVDSRIPQAQPAGSESLPASL